MDMRGKRSRMPDFCLKHVEGQADIDLGGAGRRVQEVRYGPVMKKTGLRNIW